MHMLLKHFVRISFKLFILMKIKKRYDLADRKSINFYNSVPLVLYIITFISWTSSSSCEYKWWIFYLLNNCELLSMSWLNMQEEKRKILSNERNLMTETSHNQTKSMHCHVQLFKKSRKRIFRHKQLVNWWVIVIRSTWNRCTRNKLNSINNCRRQR